MAANVMCVAFLALFLASVSKDLVYVLGHPAMRPTEANDLGIFYRSRGGYIYTSATVVAVALLGLVVPASIRGLTPLGAHLVDGCRRASSFRHDMGTQRELLDPWFALRIALSPRPHEPSMQDRFGGSSSSRRLYSDWHADRGDHRERCVRRLSDGGQAGGAHPTTSNFHLRGHQLERQNLRRCRSVRHACGVLVVEA